jgi:UDP-N-acetylglucosamine transferase subunit ALG13
MPFDRLVRAVDDWARKRERNDVFAQVGPNGWTPSYIRWEHHLEPLRFREVMAQSELIVSHAGMGSIIGALELRKPIIVMPRRADLRETRNDHQIATARRFSEMGYIRVALEREELERQLDEINSTCLQAAGGVSSPKQTQLITTLRQFVAEA